MPNNLVYSAIKAAIQGCWDEAISFNLKLLENNPHDIPTLNRLAKAYTESGQCNQAKAIYQQVLELDKYNSIAQKKLDSLPHQSNCPQPPVDLDLNFVDEPGKTITLPLIRIGDAKVIYALVPGQVVTLVHNNHSICVVNDRKDHIGALTDDATYHLKHYLQAGNTFSAVIKEATIKKVTIFIRETSRATNLDNTPTFD